MNWWRLLIVCSVLLALLLPASPAFSAPPSLPCRFYGDVQLDGMDVPEGTVITAMVGDDTYSTTTPELRYGPSTYALVLVPMLDMSYDEGTTVIFTVGDHEADQIGIWEAGGNIRLNLIASTPPPVTPTPSPSPAMTPTPVPTPSPTPTPIPTIAPSPTSTPTGAESETDAWNTIIVALCVGILIVCIMFAAYLIWKYRLRPGQPRGRRPKGPTPKGGMPQADKMEGQKADGESPAAQPMEVKMRWQDRLMLRMMSNKVIIWIFSKPIVIKIMMWETKVILSIISLFKRKKAEEQETPTVTPVEDTAVQMRWQDRLMLKMMSNKVIIWIFSKPIVIKIMMWETKVILSIISLFKRKKAEVPEAPTERPVEDMEVGTGEGETPGEDGSTVEIIEVEIAEEEKAAGEMPEGEQTEAEKSGEENADEEKTGEQGT